MLRYREIGGRIDGHGGSGRRVVVLVEPPRDPGAFAAELLAAALLDGETARAIVRDLPYAPVLADPVAPREARRLRDRLRDAAGAGVETYPEGAFRKATVRFATRRDEAAEALDRATGFFARAGVPAPDLGPLAAALREAVANAATHGNRDDPQKEVTIRLVRAGERLVVEVEDEGEGFAAEAYASAAARAKGPVERVAERAAEGGRPGGLGILMIQRAFDDVRWNPRGNRITCVKRLPPAPSAG